MELVGIEICYRTSGSREQMMICHDGLNGKIIQKCLSAALLGQNGKGGGDETAWLGMTKMACEELESVLQDITRLRLRDLRLWN